ncbi:hypothetical protein [Paenibacillus sp. oral taxon 786]|uniref:hypothetical protein n=1 Tax=Paenibacillus sp. oral taxon 786 TaxID=652715 RepID=UPI0012FAE487|nr:hypothetical protein [Paenibacillus sp. oral taxon 786]
MTIAGCSFALLFAISYSLVLLLAIIFSLVRLLAWLFGLLLSSSFGHLLVDREAGAPCSNADTERYCCKNGMSKILTTLSHAIWAKTPQFTRKMVK